MCKPDAKMYVENIGLFFSLFFFRNNKKKKKGEREARERALQASNL